VVVPLSVEIRRERPELVGDTLPAQAARNALGVQRLEERVDVELQQRPIRHGSVLPSRDRRRFRAPATAGDEQPDGRGTGKESRERESRRQAHGAAALL
jgi:hypothetical protein